jgi:hypothetical protein
MSDTKAAFWELDRPRFPTLERALWETMVREACAFADR